MYIISVIVGLAIGTIVWFSLAYLIGYSVTWVEGRYPQLVGSKGIRAGEIVACVALFLGCLGFAFWIAHLVWLQIK
ncbi:MAG: hypothetical protein L0229_20085 [Blastocatellia bacterium]|nr:hypothetical protein [Blastocatellia bacterium]